MEEKKSRSDIAAILSNPKLTACEKYVQIYGERVSRDKARHRLEKLKMQLNCQVSSELFLNKVTINNDGSQLSERVVECCEEDLKSADFLLREHGYDTEKFTLVSAQSSMWQGGKNGKALYASKIKVQPKRFGEDVVDLIEKTISEIMSAKVTLSEPVNRLCGKKLLEVCLPDLHIGLTDYKGNSGDPDLLSCKENIIYNIVSNNIDNVHIVFLGDIFHYDTFGKTTTKGTPQESYMTFEEMYKRGVNLTTSFINSVASVVKSVGGTLTIKYVPGNHDKLLGYTLMYALAGMYLDESYIKFECSQNERLITSFGCNLIGYTHGDMDRKRLSQWIYTEGKEYISDSKNIEIHVGHLHHEETFEENGVIVRYLPTIALKSRYEYDKGYDSKRKIETFLWDSVNGLESINYINL